jgi:hypothetical protein
MRRVAFRRLLPTVQLVLFAALMFMGHAEKEATYARWDAARDARGPAAKAADGKGWNLRNMWDHYIPAPTQVALAINLPAVLLALPAALLLAFLIDAFSFEAPWLFYVLYGAGVLVFWRYVGVWLDRRRDLLPSAPTPLNPVTAEVVAYIGCGALVIFGLLLAFDGVDGVFFRYYPIMTVGLILWPLLVGIALLFEARRSRKLAQAAAPRSAQI